MIMDEQQAENESELMPMLEGVAELKGLKVFLFKDEELKKYLSNINPEFGIALMATDRKCAEWNLENLKRCYLVKLGA